MNLAQLLIVVGVFSVAFSITNLGYQHQVLWSILFGMTLVGVAASLPFCNPISLGKIHAFLVFMAWWFFPSCVVSLSIWLASFPLQRDAMGEVIRWSHTTMLLTRFGLFPCTILIFAIGLMRSPTRFQLRVVLLTLLGMIPAILLLFAELTGAITW